MTKKKKGKLKPLTKTQRIAVLKDAIQQLRAGRYLGNTGTYVTYHFTDSVGQLREALKLTTNLTNKGINDLEVQKFMPKVLQTAKINGETCNVCAKGAVVISAITKFNNCTIGEVGDLDSHASDRARILFGKDNADLMEDYFENHGGYRGSRYADTDDAFCELELKGDQLTQKWEDKYPDPTDRIIAIFKNAIKHGGIFKPELEKI